MSTPHFRWKPTIVVNRDGHDPWWDLDSGAAGQRRRHALAIARFAATLAVGANLVVGIEWALRLAPALGLRV